MPRRAASAAGAKKLPSAPRSHVLAVKFPSGTKLKDLCKKEWQLGNVLGQGGFGLIYLASEDCHAPVNLKTANYVIKIEPKGNGPLFCEIHFYQRAAKLEIIQAFIAAHKLRYLGIPPYVATGLVTYKALEYRFLVMPRLGRDLQKMLLECGGQFLPHTTFAIGLRMVDALQFLHENEYVHADIKAANILFGFSDGSEVTNEVYLVDYGLAYRYTVGSEHKAYKEDLKRAHDGTIEFTSRDAHKGLAPSRRGDLEILGYCMVQWLCGKLPWESKLTDPNYVAACKENFMDNVRTQLAECLPQNPQAAGSMCSYFQNVNKLDYSSKPNYNHLRDILKTALAKSGQKDEWLIDFTAKGKKRKHAEDTPSSSTINLSPRKSPRHVQASPREQKSAESLQLPSSSKTKSPALVKKKPSASTSRTASPASAGSGSAVHSRSTAPRLTPSLPSKSRGAFNGPKKHFPMPAPTKPVQPTATKTSTTRRFRRVAAVKSDISIQTSPGLLLNK